MAEDLSAGQLNSLTESFAIIDKNGDGKISPRELFMVMLSIEHCPTKEQVERMIASMDKDGDGKVSFSEYLELMKR